MSKWRKPALLVVLALLVANSGYLAAFATPSLFYISNVLVHVALGLALLLLLALTDRRLLIWFAPAGALGIFLMAVGATTPNKWALYAHIVAAAVATLVFTALIRRRAFTMLVVLAVVFPIAMVGYRYARPNPMDRIVNPLEVATSMEQEANGPTGPFFPSSSNTDSGGLIPSNFFMESKACERCHKDIYDQWNSSAHHFGSFNNQFYRKSIEYMQETAGVKASKWCAGCHDHALFFNGRFEKPIKEQVHTPEAQAGLGCMSCHAIVHVKDSLGNGGFTIEYPEMHDLANSQNPLMKRIHDFVIYADPEPHRRAFLKPFMRKDTAEFCSSCHKVHLDIPVNSYRWFRGFNEYDNWQASGVSGQGARSFYYPKQSQTCSDCHMPLVKSNDPAAKNGMIKSHRFPGANTAVPFANGDKEQLHIVEQFLKDKQITVDIFAIARRKAGEKSEKAAGEEAGPRRRAEGPTTATTFAVGEEADSGVRAAGPPQQEGVGPIDVIRPVLRPGDDVRIDVVVRTRKVGHFFPGGTVDAFDVWTELKAVDEKGKTIYWSGALENGNGPVEKGAHKYQSFLLDANGNPINKRNAFQARSVLYVRLIPPGAADTVRFRMKIPDDASGKIRLEAKVNYRKFSWYYTNFAYAGVPDPSYKQASDNQAAYGPHYDNRPWVFTGDTSKVSGPMKQIPDLPVVVMATASAELHVGPKNAPDMEFKPVIAKEHRERWNDYGIGLLLQGDLKSAVTAFKHVTECEPEYADGWLNVARAYIQEGNTDEARPWIEHAMKLDAKLARVQFFYSQILKAEGKYDEALEALNKAAALYPRDRVVLNQIGRLHFLKREYQQAVDVLQRVLRIDPEDLMAHYTLMLAYRGAGNEEKAAHEEKLYLRFKADESAQAITGGYRNLNPEDNNERQMIHEHQGVPLKDGVPIWITPKDVKLQRAATPSPAGSARPVATAPKPKAKEAVRRVGAPSAPSVGRGVASVPVKPSAAPTTGGGGN